jgi:hypothetical protein
MPNFKKIFIFLFLISLGACVFVDRSHWALADKSLSQEEFEQAVTNGSYTKEDAEKGGVENIISTFNIATTGPETYALRQVENKGAVAQIGGLVAYMVGQPPVSTGEYLADLGSNMGLPIKSAYAQGVGWEALRPVLPIWKAFRNIAYMGFVVIFVVIGFMIMFRAKIGGQTEVTLQMALPKLVITLLLITFSYAIAGLMIDFIYIAIYLIVGVLYLGGLLTETSTPVNILLTKNPWNFVFFKTEGTNFANIFIQAPGQALQDIIAGLFGDWFADSILSEAVGGLAKLILGVALLFSLFKLFFSLLLSYLGIIISVIMAPFSLLFNALPGSTSFSSWLKGLFANVAPFPAVAGMFLLAAILIGPRENANCNDFNNPWCVEQGVGYFPQAENNQNVWVPPMLNLGSEGGGGEVNAFTGLIAFGIVMMTPQIVSQIKKMLKVEPSGFGGAIAGGLLSPLAGVGKVAQTGYGMYQNITNIKGAKAEAQVRDKLVDFMQGQSGGGKERP